MSHPSQLYLTLHDDGPAVSAVSPARRITALFFAVVLMSVAPLVWLTADAVAVTGPKATLSSDDDDDNSGPGGGGDDEDDNDQGTATKSQDPTNTGKTGVSTKQPTATKSQDPTNTGKTGVSTKQPTATKSQDPTNTGKTGVSTKA